MSDLAPEGGREDLFDTLAVEDSPAPMSIARWTLALTRVLDTVKSALEQQAQMAVLWWPVGIAIGVGFFFSLPEDPPDLSGPTTLAVALALCLSVKWLLPNLATDSQVLRLLMFAILLSAIGFCAAQVRTALVAAPILSDEIGPSQVIGSVVIVEPLGRASRVTLDRLVISELDEAATPHQVRVRLPASHGAPQVGDRIQVRAMINPPGRPVAPGGFDFQRYSFFRQLGGVGFAVGTWQLLETSPSHASSWFDRVSRLRANVGQRISTALPGESGGIARALVTGERNAVPESLQDAYRQAGLAHMLAISGLHMSLVTGLVFVLLRYGLALTLPIAERFNTKKIAAVAALSAAAFYLVLSGVNVPAQRAFIMISVVLCAVLIDRTALSLRTLAWAAMAVLIFQPETLVGASFQLSFAAVVALIAVYERVHIRASLWDRYGNFRLLRAVFLYCAAVFVTDLIASSATAPFTAFHFNMVPSYSLLANLLAGPLMGLWIMPCGLLALVLMPLGLEGIALSAMGAGIDVVDTIARFVSGLPGAVLHTPPAEVWTLICVGLGGVFVCLWRGQGRWIGLVPLTVGILQPWLATPPDILINENAEVYAVKGADGGMILSPGRRDSFTRDVWTERWGRSHEEWSASERLTCDSEGCLYRVEEASAALSFTEAAVSEDCGRFEVIVAKVPSWRLCRTGRRIDRFDVWRHGAHAVWLGEDGPHIEKVSDFTGRRIWNRSNWR